MNSEPIIDVPAPIRDIALNAHDRMVCFSGEVPSTLVHTLALLPLEPKSISFQCPSSTDLGTIAALLKQGCQVYEGSSLAQTSVFFDRRQGFSLPSWTAIPDAFTLACKLVWSRSAAFTLVSGTILSLDRPAAGNSVLLRLVESPHLRLSLPKALCVPEVGESVTLLGRHDFRFGWEMPLLDPPPVDAQRAEGRPDGLPSYAPGGDALLPTGLRQQLQRPQAGRIAQIAW